MRALTLFVLHYRLNSHHRGAPPHHRVSTGFRMWAPRHPCHGWKSGECEIFHFQLGNYMGQIAADSAERV